MDEPWADTGDVAHCREAAFNWLATDGEAAVAAMELGAAWAEAEAARSVGMLEVIRSDVIAGDENPYTGYPVLAPTERYVASWQGPWGGSFAGGEEVRGEGPTPTAALRALAAALKGDTDAGQ